MRREEARDHMIALTLSEAMLAKNSASEGRRFTLDTICFGRVFSYLTGLLLLVESCAPSLTDSQQRVYAAWDDCQRERRIDQNIQLQRVEPDGSYHVTVLGGQTGREAANMCMNEKLGTKGRWQ
jgi:hypothetical protein